MATKAQQEQAEPRPQPAGMAPRFTGKVALITGASDRGIGGAIARRMAQEGGAVSIFSRSEPKKLLKRIGRAGGEVAFTAGDVCRADDVAKAIDATMDAYGQIDVLVNNVGIETFGRLDELSDDDWQQLVDVNLTGVMRVCRAALPYLPQPGGAIVNVASALAMGGCAGFTAYSATKAGVLGFTQSLAAELAPQGIRAVSVAPALVLSPMSRQYLDEMTEATWERINQCHPLGVGLPEDVAAAVAFLASSEARWITGVTLPLGWCPTFRLPTDVFSKP